MVNLKKIARINTRKILKLQLNDDFNKAISILNSTLKKSSGYTDVAAFGKKQTINKDTKTRFPEINFREDQISRKATIRDFKVNKRYSLSHIRQSLVTANRLLSKIETPLTGIHELFLFNPNLEVEVNGSKIDMFRLLNSCGCGSVITIDDINKKTKSNFWLWGKQHGFLPGCGKMHFSSFDDFNINKYSCVSKYNNTLNKNEDYFLTVNDIHKFTKLGKVSVDTGIVGMYKEEDGKQKVDVSLGSTIDGTKKTCGHCYLVRPKKKQVNRSERKYTLVLGIDNDSGINPTSGKVCNPHISKNVFNSNDPSEFEYKPITCPKY